MTGGAAAVWVPVTDMDRAVSFYRHVLRLRITKYTSDWSEVDANGLRMGLSRCPTTATADSRVVLSYRPRQPIDDEVTRLQGRGVRFAGGISAHTWGRLAPFQDSEGNNLALYAPRGARPHAG